MPLQYRIASIIFIFNPIILFNYIIISNPITEVKKIKIKLKI